MIFKRVDHVEIVPGDAERTIDFYTGILNFKIKSRNAVKKPPMQEVIYLELGDTVIEIISVDNATPKSEAPWQVGYRGIALEVENERVSEPGNLSKCWKGKRIARNRQLEHQRVAWNVRKVERVV